MTDNRAIAREYTNSTPDNKYQPYSKNTSGMVYDILEIYDTQDEYIQDIVEL